MSIVKYDGFMTSHQDYTKTLLVSMIVLACELVAACRGFVCVPIVSKKRGNPDVALKSFMHGMV